MDDDVEEPPEPSLLDEGEEEDESLDGTGGGREDVAAGSMRVRTPCSIRSS